MQRECRGAMLRVQENYAESLTITIPPWKPPFTDLRRGRHASSRHAVVWIQWVGGDRRQFVWYDGREQPHARLTSDGVTMLERVTW